MARTKRCKCGHSWNSHDAFSDGFGRTLIVCTAIDRQEQGPHQFSVCACKEWRPVEPGATETSGAPASASATTETETDD